MFTEAAGQGPADDAGPVGGDQDVAWVIVAVAEQLAGREPVQGAHREAPQPRRQNGVVDATRQDVTEVGKTGGRVDTVHGAVSVRQHAGQAQHSPRLPLQQRQHV
jgi:hypothetical protein